MWKVVALGEDLHQDLPSQFFMPPYISLGRLGPSSGMGTSVKSPYTMLDET